MSLLNVVDWSKYLNPGLWVASRRAKRRLLANSEVQVLCGPTDPMFKLSFCMIEEKQVDLVNSR